MAGSLTSVTRGRAWAARWRTDTATIQRETATSDGMGGTTSTWGTAASGVPVSVMPLRRLGVLSTDADGLLGRNLYRLNFAADVDVRSQDRVVVGSTTYRVQTVRSNTTRGVATEAQCALES